MDLTNDFRVGVGIDRAWSVLTDVERIAPCLPGAQLQEVEGDEYRGVVKVKVGPITAQYKGAARILEQDEAARRIVIRAEGRDTRGQGGANATITATLVADGGDATKVTVLTDLTVTGKVAQFGRGVMADVSGKLMDQFVESLETMVLAGEEPAGPAPSHNGHGAGEPANGEAAEAVAAPTGVRRIESAEVAPVDLLDAAGSTMAKRVTPVLAGLAILWLLRVLLRRRRK